MNSQDTFIVGKSKFPQCSEPKCFYATVHPKAAYCREHSCLPDGHLMIYDAKLNLDMCDTCCLSREEIAVVDEPPKKPKTIKAGRVIGTVGSLIAERSDSLG